MGLHTWLRAECLAVRSDKGTQRLRRVTGYPFHCIGLSTEYALLVFFGHGGLCHRCQAHPKISHRTISAQIASPIGTAKSSTLKKSKSSRFGIVLPSRVLWRNGYGRHA